MTFKLGPPARAPPGPASPAMIQHSDIMDLKLEIRVSVVMMRLGGDSEPDSETQAVRRLAFESDSRTAAATAAAALRRRVRRPGPGL